MSWLSSLFKGGKKNAAAEAAAAQEQRTREALLRTQMEDLAKSQNNAIGQLVQETKAQFAAQQEKEKEVQQEAVVAVKKKNAEVATAALGGLFGYRSLLSGRKGGGGFSPRSMLDGLTG